MFGSRRSRAERLRSGWGRARERTRNLAAIERSHADRVAILRERPPIDVRTWADLDLEQVFAAIDRTESTLGQHALFHRLRTPQAEALPAFEALIDRLSTDAAARERAQLALGHLQDAHGYNIWWLHDAQRIPAPPAWHRVFPALSICSLLAIVGGLLFHVPGIVVAVLAGVFGLNVATLRSTSADADALRQLAPLIGAAEPLAELVTEETRALVGPLARVPEVRRLKTIARWAADNPLLLPPDAAPLVVMLNDFAKVCYLYLNLFFFIDRTAVFLGRARLRALGPLLVGIVAAMGEVDAALSVASLRAGTSPWTRPNFVEAGGHRLVGVLHPLLQKAVPNSVDFPQAGMLVTGSNMSGKSTFLRTVGVAAIMAETLNTCFAEEYAGPAFRVRSVIGRSDDIVAGKSYYLAEVEALLELVRSSDSAEPHLYLLDELFRGTNTTERIAAGEAVLRALTEVGKSARHVVIAATHDNELVDLLRDRYAAYHFGDSIGAHGLEFDYRLHDGAATTRNAIALLQMQGAPPSLVDRATATAAALDREHHSTRPPAAPCFPSGE